MEILRSIGVIARSLDSIANVEFKELQLNRGQYLYLARISEQPGIILERLAEVLKVDKTTAARAVQKLERQKLIVRKNDTENKKIKLMYPTEQGKKLYQVLNREENYSNKVALQGFSEEEKQQLYEYLQRVAKNVDSDWNYVKNGNKREY